MSTELNTTISQLTTHHKGILAADESIATLGKRFDALKIPSTLETRLAYRRLLFTTPQLEHYISGIILFDETLHTAGEEKSMVSLLCERGIIPGIKVDIGLASLPFNSPETLTQGLDGLSKRLSSYYAAGAHFAKWRATFTISETLPSTLAIQANATALAHYAALCQTHGLVPIVEPEVLMSGSHDLFRCFAVTTSVLRAVFQALVQYAVNLEQIILKPNMVLSGQDYSGPPIPGSEVAQATLKALRQTVPAAVPSINFLSGGQTPQMATQHLNAINQQGIQPWRLNFSFGRALQEPALAIWQGLAENRQAAQQALLHRVQLNTKAAKGIYQARDESIASS